MKSKFIILFIFLMPLKAYSQSDVIEINSGLGFYSMSDLKSLNQSTLQSIPFKAQITSSFPPFFYYKIGVIFKINSKISAGLIGFYNSTGSRIHIKDYSGEYKFDQMVSAYSPGITVRFFLFNKKINIQEYNNFSYSVSTLKLKEYLLLNGESKQEVYGFKAYSLQGELGLKIGCPVKSFSFGTTLGYLVDFKGCFTLKDNPDAKLRNTRTGDNVYVNWGGLRMGVFISYNL